MTAVNNNIVDKKKKNFDSADSSHTKYQHVVTNESRGKISADKNPDFVQHSLIHSRELESDIRAHK